MLYSTNATECEQKLFGYCKQLEDIPIGANLGHDIKFYIKFVYAALEKYNKEEPSKLDINFFSMEQVIIDLYNDSIKRFFDKNIKPRIEKIT